MTDTPTTPVDTPPASVSTLDYMRSACDLHCLWRFCDRRRCQRARACCSDPRYCFHFFPLVPFEAREFFLGWDDARANGLTYEQMMDEYAEEWQTLMTWQHMVRDTLPENRPRQVSNP